MKSNPRMQQRGVKLDNLDDLVRFSGAVFQSGLVPGTIKSAQAVMVVIQAGAELGIPPVQSLQSFAITSGKLSIWGDSMLGVCMASDQFDHDVFHEKFEKGVAYCTMGRIGHAPITRTFSTDDAKRAGLHGKNDIWKQYGDRMLQMRARAYACRDLFPDLLRGLGAFEAGADIEEVPIEADDNPPVKEKTALAAAMAEPVVDKAPDASDQTKAIQPTTTLAKDGEVVFGEPDPVDGLTPEEVIAQLGMYATARANTDGAPSVDEWVDVNLCGVINGLQYKPNGGVKWFGEGKSEAQKANRIAAARTHLSMLIATSEAANGAKD